MSKSLLEKYSFGADETRKALLDKQHFELLKDGVTTCASCGRKEHHLTLFRCLYCGIAFCFDCAEKHFGETFRQYQDKKRAELRAKCEDDRKLNPNIHRKR